MKAIVYTRVSTDDQVISGLGLEAQKRVCYETANLLGASEILLFSDEGISGSISIEDRPALRDALGAVSNGDTFIVAKRDRIARDMFLSLTVERILTNRKAKFVSVAGEGSGLGNDDVGGLIQRRMIDLFAEVERTMIRSRTKAALQSKKLKGERIGTIPYGYKLLSDGVHIDLCETEQQVIALIKTLATEGYSQHGTVSYLNRKRIPSRTGNRWGRTQISRILSRTND